MNWEKLIRNATLSTLAAIMGLLVFMFTVLCLFFPSTMMNITYDFGMDSSSIYFAKKAYKATGEITYIVHATEVAIGLDDEKQTVICAEKLIADEKFLNYSAERNENLPDYVVGTYEQYVYAQLCVSMYETGKRTESVERAFELLGNGFPQNNVVAAVTMVALRADDVEITQKIREKIEQLQVDSFSEVDKAYYDGLLALME